MPRYDAKCNDLCKRIPSGDDMSWLFAYGELMNEVDLRKHGARPARLAGWQRSFNHASLRLWGSAENPCPTLGLSPGGECWGVAFEAGLFDRRGLLRRLAPVEAPAEFERMSVPIELKDGARVQAVAFPTKPGAPPRWNGELDRAFLAAHGVAGRGVEYVRTIAHALKFWGIGDPLIAQTWSSIDWWRPR
jgi:glutathione-specific gamma-glutamylcyclotransferase